MIRQTATVLENVHSSALMKVEEGDLCLLAFTLMIMGLNLIVRYRRYISSYACSLNASYFPNQNRRLANIAGIALGPILFIIAILAILAAAISAGSGSFNGSTNTEGNKAKASALVQIGDNLKIGMDRLTMENGVNYNGWTTSPSNTTSNVDLFSPTGGGIAPPSISMAGNPASDIWLYPQAAIPGMGSWNATNGNTMQLAVLNITSGVCAQINNRANGQAIAPAAQALGNFATTAATGNVATLTNTNWPNTNNATSLNLYGRPVGCVQNSNAGSSGYYFYEVLYIQ